jgi:hypothetical protein
MTTLKKTIYLSHLLRGHGEISIASTTKDGDYQHILKHYREETQDYWEWERALLSEVTTDGHLRCLAVLPIIHDKKSTDLNGAAEKPFPPKHP